KRAYCLKTQPATGETYPKSDLFNKAVINYISPEAEFTPPVIYSTKRREKLIFMAEAIPALQQAGRMKIGQPFDVEIIGDE
ncbi:hypothetical protein AAGK53_07850, partial [Klebsiella pneumoniae]